MKDLRKPLLPQPGNAPPAPQSALATILCFVCFVAVRTFHPIIIDISKTDGKMLYGKATPCLMNSLVDIFIGNGVAFLAGGMSGVKRCWEPTTLKIFGTIAVAYAFGDFLEMVSMGVMGGAMYQILLQSKLLVTALMMWTMRGQKQSKLQWNVLFTIMLGMCAFVLVDDSPSDIPFQPIGLLFVLVKVFFSCLCAVLTEKYLKKYDDMPIYAQVAQLKFSWFWSTLVLTLVFDSNVRSNGIFDGWDVRTVVVACSWVCKGWSTFIVLKMLDSVLKNIGEAVAVLLIYLFDVVVAEKVMDFIPVHPKDFRLSVFLMVLVVVLTVISYTLAPAAPKPK